MSAPKFLEFKVRVPNIEGVSEREWRSYINDAVVTWCGQAVWPQNDEEPDSWFLMSDSGLMRKITVTKVRPSKKVGSCECGEQ